MSELVDIAILAFRNGCFRQAIELLLQVTANDASNWMARLYLAMAYEKAGRASDAHRQMKRLSIECTDEFIRHKATLSIPALEEQLGRRFLKESTGSSQKSDTVYADDDVILLG